jgi:hypothetical protein
MRKTALVLSGKKELLFWKKEAKNFCLVGCVGLGPPWGV